MFTSMDEVQKFSRDRMDFAAKAAAQASRGIQQIMAETADYSKRVLEHTTSTMGQLFGVRSIDRAFEIQSDYAKSTYDGFVAQAAKMGEIYTNLAKDAFRTAEQAAPAHN